MSEENSGRGIQGTNEKGNVSVSGVGEICILDYWGLENAHVNRK